jgi:hypothetical protein
MKKSRLILACCLTFAGLAMLSLSGTHAEDGAGGPTLEGVKQISSAGFPNEVANAVVLHGTDACVVGTTNGTIPDPSGQHQNASAGGVDAFAMCLDATTGESAWIGQFGTPAADVALAVAVDAARNALWVVGYTEGSLCPPGLTGTRDMFVALLDASTGTMTNCHQLGSEDGPATAMAQGVAVDREGKLYIVGSWPTPARNTDTFVRKYAPDPNGDLALEWAVTSEDYDYLDPGVDWTLRDEAMGVAVSEQGVFVSGSATLEVGRHPIVQRHDRTDGTVQWLHRFGAQEGKCYAWANSVAVDGGTVWASGSVEFGVLYFPQESTPYPVDDLNEALSGSSRGGYDAFVAAFNIAHGGVLGAEHYGTATADSAPAVSAAAGHAFVAGWTPGAASADAYLRRYRLGPAAMAPKAFTADLVRTFGSSNADQGLGIAAAVWGVAVVGYADAALLGQEHQGARDAFVTMRNRVTGDELWTRQIGNPAATAVADLALAIAAQDNDTYAVGWTRGSLVDFGQTSQGDRDAWVQCYDESGNKWTSQFGTDKADLAGAVDIYDKVYVGGSTAGVLGSAADTKTWDGFLRALDPETGALCWTAQIQSPAGDPPAAFENVFGVAAGATGIYVAGETLYTGLFPSADGASNPTFGYDGFLRKYDHDGNELWTRTYGVGDAIGAGAATAYAVADDDQGNAYVTGGVWGFRIDGEPSAGAVDLVVRKYDPVGNVVWTRYVATSGNEWGTGVVVRGSTVYVTGLIARGALPGHAWLGRTDTIVVSFPTSGDDDTAPDWAQQAGTSGKEHDGSFGRGPQIAVSAAGIYVAGGTTGVFPGQQSAGNVDGYVLRLDDTGNVDWCFQFGTDLRDSLLGALATDDGRVRVCGYTEGVFPGIDPNRLGPLGARDAIVVDLVH